MSTEKDKMLAGELYRADDEQLMQEKSDCRELLHQIKLLSVNDPNRTNLLKKLLGSTKGEFVIESSFFCDYGYNIHIGDNFFANFGFTVLDCAPVTIGSNVLIGPHVSLYTANHPISPKERLLGVEYAKPITIGNNVWIGGNCVILPGVSIGDNSIIGAGSVVTHSIQSNAVAMGNPCKVRKRNI